MKVWFLSKRLGWIAWLREYWSSRNWSSKSASSPKREEKVCISFSSCSTPRRGLSISSRHLKPLSLAKDLHQVLKPKISTSDATDIAKCRVKHHPFRHCLSRFFTGNDDLALCSERFQRKFCESLLESRYDTVLYCAHDITCRSATSWIMELWLGSQFPSAVHYKLVWEYHELWLHKK